MSTSSPGDLNGSGAPLLSVLGRRIEMLRLDRGLSKQSLAQRAGTSRQQLWRVMTGKSELTETLCARLAHVLEADSRSLRDPTLPPPANGKAPESLRQLSSISQSLSEYVRDPALLERTISTLPVNDEGRRIKRTLLNAIEEIAEELRLRLPDHFFELRRQVVNGER